MRSRKRSHSEMAATDAGQEPQQPQQPQQQKEQSLISKIRNTWEFAAVMQFIYMFGKVVKIDDNFDIEDFETECLRPGYSDKLEEIGLTLLKWISSHRGLNYEIWDEYTRRQYLAKAPHLNPYGDDEEPKKFRHFDIFLKLRVLHQLTVWTFWNPDRMRERMDEQREQEQTSWRIEELGYDAQDRHYYVLDDNRLYRRTEPPLPPPKSKAKYKSKKALAARRLARKRRRIEESETTETAETDAAAAAAAAAWPVPGTPWGPDVDTLGGFKWECLAITLADYRAVVASFGKTKDPNERILISRLEHEVMPTIEAAEEKQRRKIERRERELLAMEKMAHAKRSSRIADKQEREKQEREAAEARRKHAAELEAARRDLARQEQMENERKSRILTREQRIRDRQCRRILKEEEHSAHANPAEQQPYKTRRKSSRAELDNDNASQASADEWYFDCSKCGLHGKNFDDGSHSVACDKCNVWQHSKCLGIAKAAAEKDDFRFVCDDCHGKDEDDEAEDEAEEEDPNRPKIVLKFPKGASSSPVPASPAPEKKQTGVPVSLNNSHIAAAVSTTTGGTQPPAAQSPQPPPTLPLLQPNGHISPSSAYSLPPRPPPYHQPQQSVPQPSQPADHAYQNTFNRHAPVSPQQHPLYSRQPHSSSVWQQASSAQYPFSHATPRPASASAAHAPANGQTPAARLPSPVLNRPVMSPSQGNYDVSSLAGISGPPGPSSSHPCNGVTSPTKQPRAASTSAGGTTCPQSQASPCSPITTPSQQQQLSGLSPTKNRAPSPMLPPSSTDLSFKTGATRSPPQQTVVRARSVSGTPLFPPAEKFMPTPDQLSQEPVPTPSKQPTPTRPSEHAINGLQNHQ